MFKLYIENKVFYTKSMAQNRESLSYNVIPISFYKRSFSFWTYAYGFISGFLVVLGPLVFDFFKFLIFQRLHFSDNTTGGPFPTASSSVTAIFPCIFSSEREIDFFLIFGESVPDRPEGWCLPIFPVSEIRI